MQYKVPGRDPMELHELANQILAHKEHLNILWVSEIREERFGGGYAFNVAYKTDKPYRTKEEIQRSRGNGLIN